MTIKLVEFNRFIFYDVAGVKRDIRRIPAGKRRDFLDLMALAAQIAAKEGGEVSSLYDAESPVFRDVINDALACFGISPDWVDMGMVRSLLFGVDDEPGLLWALEFPDRPPPLDAKPLPKDIDPYASAVAALCAMFPGVEPNAIQQFIDITPWNEIERLIHARNWQITESNPELKRKRQQQEQLQMLKESLEKDLEQGLAPNIAPPMEAFAAVMG